MYGTSGIESYQGVKTYLKYGDKPFPSKELYQQALDYQSLVKGRVGEVDATCTQNNVHMLLDGKPPRQGCPIPARMSP